MASRVALQDQQRGVEKQKIGQADTRNMRVLGDIGNLVQAPVVAEGKTKISRPITRSFGAQLLAKAQKDAEKNIKKLLAEVVNGIVVGKPGVAVRAPAFKKDPIKQNAVENDHADEKDKNTNSGKKNHIAGSSKNETLTSFLTARSKAACGLENKPKVVIVDIDASDVDNELAAVEYVEDIYSFYK